MSAPSVLYDAPGPKAKLRNMLYALAFVFLLAGAVWWLLTELGKTQEMNADKWTAFVDAKAWTDFLIPGLLNTLQAAALAIVIALPLGAVLGIARLSDHAWVRWPAGIIVEFFRAVPVLILMLFANALFIIAEVDSDIRPLYAVVTGLVLYNASVLAEVVRAGILSLPRGQTEAGMALGMRKGQLMNNVLLPQSVTAMLPAIVSQLVVIVKDTAIGGPVVNFQELISQARPLGTAAGIDAGIIASLVVIATIFIVLNFMLTQFAGWLEKKLRTRKKGSRAVLTADMVEQQAPGVHMEDTEAGAAGREK